MTGMRTIRGPGTFKLAQPEISHLDPSPLGRSDCQSCALEHPCDAPLRIFDLGSAEHGCLRLA